MSVSGSSRSYDYSYSDDSIIVSTASSTSDEPEDENVQSKRESSDNRRVTKNKTMYGGTTTTTNTTTTTTTQVVPVMVTRSHLLDECPSDVRFYFSSKYVADENSSPEQQAIHLRHYAGISKSHHKEVIEVLNRLPSACIASTRKSLPTLATFAKGEKERKNCFDQASRELFQTYHHVYANVSTSNLHDDKGVSYFPKGLRQLALKNLLESDHIKEFILDVSHDPYKFASHEIPDHINLWSGKVNKNEARGLKNENKQIAQWKSDLKERGKLSDTLCESLRKFSKSAGSSSVSFALKCVNQPFKIFLAPLAQTLADCKEGLGAINSLDLGFSFFVSGYEYEYSKTGQNMVLMATYANNLARFIESNKKLKHVSLCRNDMNSTLLLPVAKALRQNMSLESLDISKNYLSSHSGNSEVLIKTLIDSLAGKPSLRHVNLAGCGLNDGAADLLLDFLKQNPRVTICIAENMMISESHPIFKLENIEAEHSDVDYSSS